MRRWSTIKNKYHSKKVRYNGIEFDSKKEMQRYAELRLLERAGKISNLELQKVFELIPAQYETSTEVITRGKNKGERKKGKCIEKAVAYKADFTYTDEKGFTVVEDTKGFKTKDYIIKRKLMLYVHGIRIVEI